MASTRWSIVVCVVFFVVLAQSHQASGRPLYGNSCISCHGSAGFGHDEIGSLMSITGTHLAEIPSGAFGDPDRGEGPLPTYTASPGSTFELSIHLDTPTGPFLPERFAVGIKNIEHTDPDFQSGNLDPSSWRDGQLLLEGAQPYGVITPPNPAPLPTDESEWTLYTNFEELQYYASTGEGGHAWTGPVTLRLDVTVPSGVLPGWYDLEVTTAGWDRSNAAGQYAFVDQANFYLNVVPEPNCILLLVGCLAALGLRSRHDSARHYG